MNFRTEGHYKINYVILNAVKDLALGLCRNICEILRVAQNDINEETNADDNANVIPIFYGRGLQQPNGF